nr:DUF1064 domain-containing protein [Fructilactobacillus florum]
MRKKSVSIHESFVILDGITVNGKKRRRRRYTPDFVYRDEKGEITKVVDVKPTKITADASLRIAMFVFRYKVPVTIARYDSRSGLFEEKEM